MPSAPKPRIPLHLKLRKTLIAQFDQYSDGERLPTEMEIAEKHKISRLTVHKVLNELQRDGYVIRQAGRGTFVRHGDRQVHTDEIRTSKGSILVAYPDWFSFDFWSKLRRARQLAHSKSLGLVDYMFTSETMYESLQKLWESRDDIRGVIIIPPAGPISDDAVKLFDSFGVPVVLLSPNAKLPKDVKNVYMVNQDYGQIGYIDVSTLLDRGHEKIAYIASEPWDESYRLQLEGMRKALADRDLPRKTLWSPKRHVKPWEPASNLAYEITKDVLVKVEPTALIFDNMPDAMGGMRAAWESPDVDAEKLTVVLNAPWLGLEKYFWPPPILIACELSEIVDQAFAIILGEYKSTDRKILVNVRVKDGFRNP
ncbi:GntR family transcriptional regulator [Kiritimatiellota bacterium B12222]|nr:GntR family transcriptional regulator [Kiritimatiellota bacterium B12222]